GVDFARKNGADTARVQAIQLLAEDKTAGIHASMIDALTDSDAGVRAAAVRAVGQFHRRADEAAVGALLDDPKQPVRLSASAAYINCYGRTATHGHR
ncbi:MAG: HEAT repeat domain-containing protein, partial [Bryocella sp.]